MKRGHGLPQYPRCSPRLLPLVISLFSEQTKCQLHLRQCYHLVVLCSTNVRNSDFLHSQLATQTVHRHNNYFFGLSAHLTRNTSASLYRNHSNHIVCVYRDAETKKKSSQVKIGSAPRQIRSKLQSEDKNIPCQKVQYLVAMAIWRPGVVHFVCLIMYVCMHACVYVCMYTCMNVCVCVFHYFSFPLSVSFDHCSIFISIQNCTVITTRSVRCPVTLQERNAILDIGRHWQKMHLEHSPSRSRIVKAPPPNSVTILIAVSRRTDQVVKTNSQHRTSTAHGSDRCHLENRTGVTECLTELS